MILRPCALQHHIERDIAKAGLTYQHPYNRSLVVEPESSRLRFYPQSVVVLQSDGDAGVCHGAMLRIAENTHDAMRVRMSPIDNVGD